MERDEEIRKHTCKICSKSFSSGRSLGGHMRSHGHSSSDAEEKEKAERSRGYVVFGAGYALRENPKKTWRLADFAEEDECCCKDCGREFPSWKALFGHMRSHSARTGHRAVIEAGDVEEEGSLIGKKDSLENIFDDNELLLPPVAPRRKRRTKRASPAIAPATASSSSITDYEPEQEEVAISLMMLSRDIGGYSAPTAAESSDKNSVILEDGYLGLEDDSYDRLEMNNAVGSADLGKQRAMLCKKGIPINGLDKNKAGLGSGYQCLTCNKTFTSYHALGGHRASHKRIRTCCMPKNNDGVSENTSEASVEQSPLVLSKKSRIHECVICGKVFSSGQALGGHKRSHLASSGEGGGHQMVTVSELLDLNLPASVNEGSTNLSPWWVGEGLKHEHPLLSLFSN